MHAIGSFVTARFIRGTQTAYIVGVRPDGRYKIRGFNASRGKWGNALRLVPPDHLYGPATPPDKAPPELETAE